MTAPEPRLDEIQARLSAATPGPWFQGREGKRYEDTRDVYTEREVSATSRDIGRIDYPEDAALIANAPTDVHFLLAELRKAHEALLLHESFRDLIMALAEKWEVEFPSKAADLRAAVAAANGDGRD